MPLVQRVLFGIQEVFDEPTEVLSDFKGSLKTRRGGEIRSYYVPRKKKSKSTRRTSHKLK